MSNLKGQYSEGPRELCPNKKTAMQFDWLKIIYFDSGRLPEGPITVYFYRWLLRCAVHSRKERVLIPTSSKLIANWLTSKLRIGRSLDRPYWMVLGWSPLDGPFWMVPGWSLEGPDRMVPGWSLDGPLGWFLDGESSILIGWSIFLSRPIRNQKVTFSLVFGPLSF